MPGRLVTISQLFLRYSSAALLLPVLHPQLAGVFLLPPPAQDCHTEGDPGQPAAGHDPHHP